MIDQICRTLNSAKFDASRNFEGKFGKGSAKIPQIFSHARERDGAMHGLQMDAVRSPSYSVEQPAVTASFGVDNTIIVRL